MLSRYPCDGTICAQKADLSFTIRTMNEETLDLKNIPDVGIATNIEVMQRLVELRGKTVLDIGCGALTFSTQLAEQGAMVIGIDPDPIQAEKNRSIPPIDNVRFVEANAEQLPVDDESMDGVTFCHSLHHIPMQRYPRVFREVIRVLRNEGFLYVIEPIDCPLNQVIKLFHDEDQARADAQFALSSLAKPRFLECDEVVSHSTREFESFDDFARFFSDKSFNTGYTEAQVRTDLVRQAFEHHGAPDYQFDAPKRITCLKRLRPPQNR